MRQRIAPRSFLLGMNLLYHTLEFFSTQHVPNPSQTVRACGIVTKDVLLID
jgi:hypothetical protein